MKNAPLVLKIEGIGSVPAFKNSKEISVNRKSGKRFLRTHPKKKAWMEACIASFECQLRSWCQTIDAGTPPECSKPSWTALSMLSGMCDDSIREFPQGEWTTLRVPHGCEGATITIEPL